MLYAISIVDGVMVLRQEEEYDWRRKTYAGWYFCFILFFFNLKYVYIL